MLGTHGRGFWILDDIDPLRQRTPDIYDAALKLVNWNAEGAHDPSFDILH